VISYPVQFSNIPKILQEYIVENQQLWKGKKIFIIATMGIFSGDGAGILARLLKKIRRSYNRRPAPENAGQHQ